MYSTMEKKVHWIVISMVTMVTSRQLLDRSRCCTMDTKTIPLQAECRDEAVKYEAFLTGQFASICSTSWMARQLTWSYCLTSGTQYSYFLQICLGLSLRRLMNPPNSYLSPQDFQLIKWTNSPMQPTLNLWRGITILWALFAGFLADLPWIPIKNHHFWWIQPAIWTRSLRIWKKVTCDARCSQLAVREHQLGNFLGRIESTHGVCQVI